MGFLRSPVWVAGHALALAVVVAFVNLGLWQLRRLDEVREHNATVSARLAEPPRPLATVLADVGADAEELAYRRVTVSGQYRPDEEILLSTRSYRGAPGHHLLTPLETAAGEGVIVDRGWVPYELDDPPVAAAAPGSGEVTVTGVLFPPQPSPSGGRDRVEFLRQVDLDRLGRQVSIDLAPVYVLAQDEPSQALPRPAELPTLDEGNHLSYAVQWFLFAGVVAVGYPLLIRRRIRDRAASPSGPVGRARPQGPEGVVAGLGDQPLRR
jgi:surfeit locus 1 family protein